MHFFPNIPVNVLMLEDYRNCCSYLMNDFVCMTHASMQSSTKRSNFYL